jgi:hypothetical protein
MTRSLSSSGSVSAMAPPDFMNVEAQTPLRAHYVAAGVGCEFSTNAQSLLSAANESFFPVKSPPARIGFRVRIWSDESLGSAPPWPNPYARGLDHLVFVGLDPDSSMLIDLETKRVIGRFSSRLAADQAHVNAVVFPIMLSILSSSIGVVELHCACVSREGQGFLLFGPSGSGKSTLSVALSRCGFGFLSDDRTYCSQADDRLSLWGIHTQLKLRRDAENWFRELKGFPPNELHKGETVFRFQPEVPLGLERIRRCEPACLVFLERSDTHNVEITSMASPEAAELMVRDLIAASPDVLESSLQTIRSLSELPCWHLRYGNHPTMVAKELAEYLPRLPLLKVSV